MHDNLTTARYSLPTQDFLKDKRIKIKNTIVSFAKYHDISINEFKTTAESIDKIITRINQRENYYLSFHDAKLAQSRQAAIMAYWILRYRPLRPVIPWNKGYDINVHFAYFILFSETLSELVIDSSKEMRNEIINSVSKEHTEGLLRGLSEYDISKEAMMLISDSIESAVRCEIKNYT